MMVCPECKFKCTTDHFETHLGTKECARAKAWIKKSKLTMECFNPNIEVEENGS